MILPKNVGYLGKFFAAKSGHTVNHLILILWTTKQEQILKNFAKIYRTFVIPIIITLTSLTYFHTNIRSSSKSSVTSTK